MRQPNNTELFQIVWRNGLPQIEVFYVHDAFLNLKKMKKLHKWLGRVIEWAEWKHEQEAVIPEDEHHRCKHPKKHPEEPSICPYDEDINGIETLCFCCTDCTKNCMDDI